MSLISLVVVAGAAAAVAAPPLAAPDLGTVVVDLGGPWRTSAELSLGGAKGALAARTVAFDDASWPVFSPPGHVALPKGEEALWLRRRFTIPAGAPSPLALRLGAFAGKVDVYLDGVDLVVLPVPSALVFVDPLPALAAGEHVIAIRVAFGKRKEGLWWHGARPAIGTPGTRKTGFFAMKGGYAIWVPAGYTPDPARPAPLVVALHGYGGSIHSFVPYGIGAEADRTGAIILFAEGGKSLYIEEHEDAILRAIDEVTLALPVDPDRIGLLGVSMGGAGALGVGFHHPDRFAGIVSYFGDSLYDMKTYVKRTLRTETMAARYSVLHVPENARHLPVFLIHGRADKVCPYWHTEKLHAALEAHGCPIRLEAPEADGHTVALVSRLLPAAFDFLLALRRVRRPGRVTYGKNHDAYPGAYWVRAELAREGEFGFVDAEARPSDGTLEIRRATGVKALALRLADAPAGVYTRLVTHLEKPLRLRIEAKGASGWASPFRPAAGARPACAKARATKDGADAAVVMLPAGDCGFEWAH